MRTCNYREMTNELLRDRLVCGIKEDSIREVLLQTRNLTLPEAIDICKSAEIASTQLKSMADLEKQESKVHVIRKKLRKVSHKEEVKVLNEQTRKKSQCSYCEQMHCKGRNQRSAYGQKCQLSNKYNHFASVCKSRAAKVYSVTKDQDSDEDSITTVSVLSNQSESSQILKVSEQIPSKLYATVYVEGQEVRFQLDTGASCNVISQSDLPSHVPIQVTCQSLMLFDASKVQPVGKCTVRLLNPKNGHKYRGEFVVVERFDLSVRSKEYTADETHDHST